MQSGDIFKHKGWEGLKPAFEKHTLHFIGLLSDGGVHSRYDQLLLCLQGVKLQVACPDGTLLAMLTCERQSLRQWCGPSLGGVFCTSSCCRRAPLIVQGLPRRVPRGFVCTRSLMGAVFT